MSELRPCVLRQRLTSKQEHSTDSNYKFCETNSAQRKQHSRLCASCEAQMHSAGVSRTQC